LDVQLWAIQQRGDAEYAKLTTEARSVADAQEALAMQIDAQIAAARKSLDAELAKIANSIQSVETIANADYKETLTQADVLKEKTKAEINRTNAQFAMEQSTLKAQIERDRQLAMSQSLRGEAAYERMVANANASKTSEIAALDAQNATAEANMNIMMADNTAKREAAKAYLDAVKSRFVARVEQVKAERAIDAADTQNLMAMKRSDLDSALAEARTAREQSNRKLAELQKKQAELQTASLTNWSSKLALIKQSHLDFKPLPTMASNPEKNVTPVTKVATESGNVTTVAIETDAK
jgi:hypothetical protein